MSTYVFSDVHGHSAALRRVLERISPEPDDHFFCLGDMIDRGPDPVGVMRLTRELPNVRVLMGNHEDLMLQALGGDDSVAQFNWGINGGGITADALAELDDDVADELVDWVRHLPRWAYARVAGQLYLMCHAGVRLSVPTPEAWDDEGIRAYFSAQSPEDLLWIREDFWGSDQSLADKNGEGPIVVCGHTPTVYLPGMAASLDREPLNDDERAQMVRVGADARRWDIDAGAAGGSTFGQVLVVRLDDGQEFYEPIGENE